MRKEKRDTFRQELRGEGAEIALGKSIIELGEFLGFAYSNGFLDFLSCLESLSLKLSLSSFGNTHLQVTFVCVRLYFYTSTLLGT